MIDAYNNLTDFGEECHAVVAARAALCSSNRRDEMTGDEVVIAELREARQLALESREMGVRDTSDWRRGYTAGCILTAKHNMVQIRFSALPC